MSYESARKYFVRARSSGSDFGEICAFAEKHDTAVKIMKKLQGENPDFIFDVLELSSQELTVSH